MHKFLHIVRGISGSGKSTLAKAIAAKLQCSIVEADMYHIDSDGIYRFKAEKIGHAHNWCQTEVKNQLDLGNSVVVSNTFTTAKELVPYVKMVLRHPTFRLVISEPPTPWRYDVDECFKRNTHNVPLEVLKAQRARWFVLPEGEYEAQVLLERVKGITHVA